VAEAISMNTTLYNSLYSFIVPGYSIIKFKVWWEATHSGVLPTW